MYRENLEILHRMGIDAKKVTFIINKFSNKFGDCYVNVGNNGRSKNIATNSGLVNYANLNGLKMLYVPESLKSYAGNFRMTGDIALFYCYHNKINLSVIGFRTHYLSDKKDSDLKSKYSKEIECYFGSLDVGIEKIKQSALTSNLLKNCGFIDFIH